MGTQDVNQEFESRPPELTDLLKICDSLNSHGVKYVVIGGMAMIQAGYVRTTEDIDLLVDSDRANLERLLEALAILPDKASLQASPDDFLNYSVLKIADEIVVDVLTTACGYRYDQITGLIEEKNIDQIAIPFASVRLLWQLKQTLREKDQLDLIFLREKLKNSH